MDEAVFRDKVNNSMLFRDLHGYGEVVGRLWWEVNIDVLLGEWRVRRLVVNFDNVQLESIRHDVVEGKILRRTLAPVAVRTANVKSLVGF